MKNLPFFLTIVMVSLISCSQSEQTDSIISQKDTLIVSHNPYPDGFELFDYGDNICFIKYRNKINGFDVRIAVSPYAYFDSSLRGNAKIGFFRNDTCFMSFPNPFFRIDSLNIDTICNYDVVELVYEQPHINKSKPIEFKEFASLPFFFLDVNFDEKDELIMKYASQGQRYINAYVAYGLQYRNGKIGYDYLYDSTRGIAPFSNLDDWSVIDYTKKEISTYCNGGYSDNEKRIYRLINGKISLHRIEDYDCLGEVLARRQIFRVDTTYHNGREYLFKK